jgi:hypothetical protein
MKIQTIALILGDHLVHSYKDIDSKTEAQRQQMDWQKYHRYLNLRVSLVFICIFKTDVNSANQVCMVI